MTSLIDYLSSSSYQEAKNYLRYTSPKEVIVHVEDWDDVRFWSGILQPHEKRIGIKFAIFPYSSESNDAITGKSNLLKKINHLGKYSIVCMDSDYDYLLEHSESAKAIQDNPYVFQTYTYSIENFRCFSEGLSAVCTDLTCTTKELIDFEVFFTSYSGVIYELFVWNLLFSKKNSTDYFSITEFSKIMEIPKQHIKLENEGEQMLEVVKQKSNAKLASVRADFLNFEVEIELLKESILQKGCGPKNAYLFVRGHTLQDMVVKPIIEKIKSHVHGETIKLIKEKSSKNQETSNKINAYNNSINNKDILSSLSSKNNFINCHLI
jgi:hypothetical protein